jgi:methenyltetrahydromethanopterin cyclohydrolase
VRHDVSAIRLIPADSVAVLLAKLTQVTESEVCIAVRPSLTSIQITTRCIQTQVHHFFLLGGAEPLA